MQWVGVEVFLNFSDGNIPARIFKSCVVFWLLFILLLVLNKRERESNVEGDFVSCVILYDRNPVNIVLRFIMILDELD